MIKARNMKAGVAISPDTPSSAITDQLGSAVDMLLVMTVYPGEPTVALQMFDCNNVTSGRGGQSFLERCLTKVTELRTRFPDKNIEVDGGVGPKTIDVCAHAGPSCSKYF